ncbi:carbon-nitrogen hydrolase family protein [Aestuariivita boseongensis]|uniref:carbon-nitrogen hydrolase family protein n=1 Tax=Aestuariivita boseongensis TaxID=1470562 RepID=UPI0006830A24|nr:carbon-nitrogen hydrolase family protein [Aestuariivita boseongensis]
MRGALVQLTSGDDPEANLIQTSGFIADAAAGGAEFILTPEVTNCVSASRMRQNEVLAHEADDKTLAALRAQAADLGIWLLIGSLAVKTDDPDGRFANRSFMIDPSGEIVARYDKIHMFDVQVSAEETYRESAGYRPGEKAVIVQTPFGPVGMTICYDIRFPYLYQALAQAGARILTVPSAFSPVTGAAHWESLLRARAIETGCYVLAPAQTGTHPATRGRERKTYGHSMVISPWGEVLVDGGTERGIHFFDLDGTSVDDARRKVPSLTHVRPFEDP